VSLMANKEVRIPLSKVSDPQTITDVTRTAMKEAGCNIHQNEVAKMDDDFKTGERVLSVQKKQYFCVGDIPWHSTKKDKQ